MEKIKKKKSIPINGTDLFEVQSPKPTSLAKVDKASIKKIYFAL